MSNKRLRSGKICIDVSYRTPKVSRVLGGKVNRRSCIVTGFKARTLGKSESKVNRVVGCKARGEALDRLNKRRRCVNQLRQWNISPEHLRGGIKTEFGSRPESVLTWRSSSVNSIDTDTSSEETFLGPIPLRIDPEILGAGFDVEGEYRIGDLPIPDLPVTPVNEAREYINRIPIAPPLPLIPQIRPAVFPRRRLVPEVPPVLLVPQELPEVLPIRRVINNMAEFTAMKPSTFHGVGREDANEFLRLFNLYLDVHAIVKVEPVPVPNPPATAAAVTRFKLCVSGECARWVQSLPDDFHWPEIEAAFREKYCNLSNSWTENVCLREIKQSDTDSVQRYVNRLSEQVRFMGKDMDNCLWELMNGFRPEIRREVLLSSPATVDDVVRHAKLAESVLSNPVVRSPPSISVTNPTIESEAQGLKKEVASMIEEMRKVTKEMANVRVSSNNGAKVTESIQSYQNNSRPNNQNNGNGNQQNGSGYGGRNNYGGNRWGGNQNQNRGGYNNGGSRFQNFNRRPQFDGTCFRCLLYGHRASECRRNLQYNGGNNRLYGNPRNGQNQSPRYPYFPPNMYGPRDQRGSGYQDEQGYRSMGGNQRPPSRYPAIQYREETAGDGSMAIESVASYVQGDLNGVYQYSA